MKRGRSPFLLVMLSAYLFLMMSGASFSQTMGDARRLLREGKELYDQARFEETLVKWQEGFRICKKLDNRQGEAAFLGNMGQVYYCLCDYGHALENYRKALGIQQDIGDRKGEGAELNNIGALFYALGDYGRALEYYQKALRIQRENGNRSIEATVLHNIGLAYDDRGDCQHALEYYQKVEIIHQSLKDRSSEATALTGMASVYGNLGEYRKALEYLNKSREIQLKTGDRSGEGVTLTGLGVIYCCLGEHKKSLENHRKALEIFQSSGDRDGIFRNLGGMGWTYEKMNLDDKAEECLIKSIDVLESIRETMKVEEHKISFMRDKGIIYEKLVQILVRKGRKEEAWNYAERARSRTFLDMLGNQKMDFRIKAAPALISEIERKEREIVSLRSQMEREKNVQRQKDCKATIAALQREYDEALENLKLSNPDYASLKTVQVFSLIEIKELMEKDSLILEYFIGSQWSCLFIIEKNGLCVAEIPCTEESLQNKISALRTLILARRECKKEIQALSDMLLGYDPVRDALPAKKKIVVIPHAALHYIPFCLLVNREGQYLVKNHQIVTQPSASVWKLCAGRKRNEAGSIGAYALGDMNVSLEGEEIADNATRGSISMPMGVVKEGLTALPGTKDEVAAIAGLYGDKTVLIGRDMTYAGVRDTMKGKSVVHFATHGILDPLHPMFSGLVLSDRLLTTADIFNLNVDANLVVLSACDTAGGEVLRGDEIVGMSRAFMYAGAPAVMASQWSVADISTTQLMKSFYQDLRQGKSETQSLQNAQLRVMKNYPHPYYWAPFVLIGEAKSPERHRSSTGDYSIPAAAAAVLIISAVAVLLKRAVRRRNH